MALTKLKQETTAANKKQISLTISPSLLARVDGLAAQAGQSRTAIINLAILRAVQHGLVLDGLKS